jgi:hypothetical protein
VRIRIVKSPLGSEFIPFDVSRLRPGEVYEIGPRLAELLIVCGYGKPEDDVEEAPSTRRR